MTEHEPTAEGTGATVGEAKWAAVKALGRHFPGAAAQHVTFEVLSDDAAPDGARVQAELDVEAWEAARADSADASPAERVRELLTMVADACGLRASVSVEEDVDAIRGEIVGPDLAVLIGRHGQTIDAIQLLAGRIAFHGEQDRKRVIVDAAGYRARRAATLQREGDLAADEALSRGEEVALEPMSASDRRVVHEHLRERGDVATHSEGDEPERYLVVSPLAP